MDKITAKALEDSIKHWENNANVDELASAYISVNDCALCTLFYPYECEGCPITGKTNRRSCIGSPYWRAQEAYCDRDLPAFKLAAADMVEFLKSLRDTTKETTK